MINFGKMLLRLTCQVPSLLSMSFEILHWNIVLSLYTEQTFTIFSTINNMDWFPDTQSSENLKEKVSSNWIIFWMDNVNVPMLDELSSDNTWIKDHDKSTLLSAHQSATETKHECQKAVAISTMHPFRSDQSHYNTAEIRNQVRLRTLSSFSLLGQT